MVDNTVSPSTMMKNSPYRSAMWCGCQVVAPARSANSGTINSKIANRTNSGTSSPGAAAEIGTRAIQQSWTITMPTA